MEDKQTIRVAGHTKSYHVFLSLVHGLGRCMWRSLGGIFSLSLLRSGRALTRGEGAMLVAFYAAFAALEFLLRDWTPAIGIK